MAARFAMNLPPPYVPEIGLASVPGLVAAANTFSGPDWAVAAAGTVALVLFIEWSLSRRFKPVNDFLLYLREKEKLEAERKVKEDERAAKEEARQRAREDSIDEALRLAIAGRETDRDTMRALAVNDARQQAILDTLVAEVKSLKEARRM